MKKFNFFLWFVKIFDIVANYKLLSVFSSNDNVRNEFKNSYYIDHSRYDSENNIQIKERISLKESGENFQESRMKDLDKALYFYSNQVLVLYCSYFEVIIQDFLEVLFYNSQKFRDNSCIQLREKYKDNGGIINKLSTFSNNNSEVSTRKFCSFLASLINTGKYKKRINRISSYFDIKFNDEKLVSICDLYERRNKIVHQVEVSDINIETLELYFGVVKYFVLMFAKYLDNNNLPIDGPKEWLNQVSL